MRFPVVSVIALTAIFTTTQFADAQQPPKSKWHLTAGPYQLHLVKIGDSYQGLKYKAATGETWQIVVDRWEKVAELGPCPAGDYDITIIPSEKGFQAIRMERHTGRTALLSNRKWAPVKDPAPGANPAKKPAPGGKGYALRYVRAGNQLHFIRFNKSTGAAAHINGGVYKALPETAGPPPAGNYDVIMMATKNNWMAFRFDHLSGGTWLLRANQWVKVTDPN